MKEFIDSIGPQLKNYFISENKHLTELDIKEPASTDFNEITEDDEVWLVQCPKDLDPEKFLNNKIKLPGKSAVSNMETVSVTYKTPKALSFGCKKKKKFSLKNIMVDGSILIREKLPTIKKETEFDLPKQQRVPFPDNLKERHPLLGYNFGESITLPDEIQQKLQKARSASLDKSKDDSLMETIKIEESAEEDDVVFVKSEKVKSKKRKSSKGDDSQPKKKKSKASKEEADDIQWIKDI